MANDTTSLLIVDQCIEGLFEYRGDGSIEPTGATGYEASDDGLVYTIHLRQDAVWSAWISQGAHDHSMAY